MRGRLWVGLCNGLAVSPLVAIYPLVTMLLSGWLFGRLELSPKRIAGATLAVVGVVLLLAG
jgi:drug/metabolite transporter (DMT)-like permease